MLLATTTKNCAQVKEPTIYTLEAGLAPNALVFLEGTALTFITIFAVVTFESEAGFFKALKDKESSPRSIVSDFWKGAGDVAAAISLSKPSFFSVRESTSSRKEAGCVQAYNCSKHVLALQWKLIHPLNTNYSFVNSWDTT